jgi:hypothetical protein
MQVHDQRELMTAASGRADPEIKRRDDRDQLELPKTNITSTDFVQHLPTTWILLRNVPLTSTYDAHFW